MSDRRDRLNCTQNNNGEEKKLNQGNYISYPHSPHVQIQILYKLQGAVDVTFCAENHHSERMNRNKMRVRGKETSKNIYLCLYLYIFIYL